MMKINKTQITKKRVKKGQRGFTLMEMIVSAGLLVMLVLAISGIYINSMKANKRLAEVSRLQQEVQYLMESFTKKIRMSEINYDYTRSGESELALLDAEGGCTVYKLFAGQTILKMVHSDDASCPDNPADFANLSSGELNIQALRFYIQPASQDLIIESYFQPRVTISMKVKIIGSDAGILVQETIPQRFTERK